MDLAAKVGAYIFCLAVGVMAYSYLIYPLLVGVLAAVRPRNHRTGERLPTVTMLVAAHNESAVIGAKLENSLALDYPPQLLQVRVISDGSQDGTDEIVREYSHLGVELQRVSPRGGKPNALNQAMPFARGEILLMCDANTMLHADALRRLVRHFEDPLVGAVTGDVRLGSDGVTYGRGEGLFWRLERFIQLAESRIGSAIGVDGGMYAMRRELYVPNRPDTLIDDFVIAMNVAIAGRRVLLDPSARADEDSVADAMQEFRRRVRTAAGGFQSLLNGLGRPGIRQAGLLAGYVSHKVIRWLGPVLMIAAFAGGAAAALGGGWFWVAVFAAQGVFYMLAFTGHLRRTRRLGRLLCLPYYFCLANAAALGGLIRYMRGSQSVTWAQADRTLATRART